MKLDNDKAFAIYALALLAGLASLLAASLVAGFATLPSPLSFFEHVSLGLALRAAYKGIGGFSWDDWSLLGDRVGQATSRPELAARPGITAGATS
jgi:hypothetical protein